MFESRKFYGKGLRVLSPGQEGRTTTGELVRSKVDKRVLRGVGANAYGQISSVLVQLIGVPVYLHHWSTEQYGQWLTITAIPSYLALSDFGLMTAAANKMVELTARGQQRERQLLFAAVLKALLAFALCVGVLGLAGMAIAAAWDISRDHSGALALVSMIVPLNMLSGLAAAGFRASGRYAYGQIWATTVQIAGQLGFLLALVVGSSSFVLVATGGLLGTLLVLMAFITACRLKVESLQWRLMRSGWGSIRPMLRPSLGFSALTIVNVLMLQSATLIVSIVSGSSAVVVLNVCRTLSRTGIQLSAALGHALWPRFSELSAMGQYMTLRRLYEKADRGIFWMSLAVGVGVLSFGSKIISVWTTGSVRTDLTLILLIATYATLGSYSHLPRVLLMATDNHGRLASYSLIAAIGFMVLLAPTARFLDTQGVFALLVANELLLLIGSRLICSTFWSRMESRLG